MLVTLFTWPCDGSTARRGASREKNLKLCVSDKQGGFVVLDAESYDKRADEAMGKNFVPIDPVKLKESKQDIVSLLAKENLDSLFGKVKGTKNGCLQVFYAAKDHKPGIPFRAIVSESGTWQAQVSNFLAKHLARIEVRDPYMIANSRDVLSYLEGDQGRAVSGFSVDVQDLYYSIPHAKLMSVLRATIEKQGLISFKNVVGTSCDALLELLNTYLRSTAVHIKAVTMCNERGYA
ncbi:hypothetical protein HPB48_019234 [Haemaphysalis longicornis]|uniref:Tick transposon n=1 Tax=Haemaphysalis longicornis TaxID=44386 RepID=A0A9J6GA61_HAELO|nr:hypothetical protein HPB48_019234 [Haemaphysalis longicornis]